MKNEFSLEDERVRAQTYFKNPTTPYDIHRDSSPTAFHGKQSPTDFNSSLVLSRNNSIYSQPKDVSYDDGSCRSSLVLDRTSSQMITDSKLWAKDFKCYVCNRIFDKLKGIFQHHCRLCASSVCSECSTQRVEDKRVCDVCYFKKQHERAEDRRIQTLISKDMAMEQCRLIINQEKEKIQQLDADAYELANKIAREDDEKSRQISNYEVEFKKTEDQFKRNNEVTKRFKGNLDVLAADLYEKQQEAEKLRQKLNVTKIELNNNRALYNSKIEEYSRLCNQKKNYEKSPSFVGGSFQTPYEGETPYTDEALAYAFKVNRASDSVLSENDRSYAEYQSYQNRKGSSIYKEESTQLPGSSFKKNDAKYKKNEKLTSNERGKGGCFC